MDERTLDRVARTAGILRNRADVGANVMHWGCSVMTPPELGEFAADVQDLVVYARLAMAREGWIRKVAEGVSVSVTTADVDLFAPPRSAEEPFPAEPSYLRPDGWIRGHASEFRFCGPGGRFDGLGVIDDDAE